MQKEGLSPEKVKQGFTTLQAHDKTKFQWKSLKLLGEHQKVRLYDQWRFQVGKDRTVLNPKVALHDNSHQVRAQKEDSSYLA